MAVLIFAHGELESGSWLEPYLARATAIIAADGGSRHLMALGRRPDVLIGDIDSLSNAVRDWLAEGNTVLVPHPAEKDETDLELALVYAVDQYTDDILVFGVLGGRLDQTLANILLLAHPALRGRSIQIVTPHERAWLVDSETTFQGRTGDRVSLIPLHGDAYVAATTGLRWPLLDDVLRFGWTRGVSNVMSAATATVHLQSGRLLCILTDAHWQR